MFRCDRKNLPKCLLNFWRSNRDVSGRESRNKDKFYQETINFNRLANHPYFYYPKLFNDLDDVIKSDVTEKEFIVKVKSLLLENLV